MVALISMVGLWKILLSYCKQVVSLEFHQRTQVNSIRELWSLKLSHLHFLALQRKCSAPFWESPACRVGRAWLQISLGHNNFSFLTPSTWPSALMHRPGKPWQLLCSCHTGHRQHGGVAVLTWWVLMEWSSATVQSTSGSGDPEPLQVMTAFSPSRTVRFTWLTLISGRSRGAK